MKTSLKRSEIIEQFHYLTGDPKPISITKMSVLEFSKTYKIYILVISRKEGFQVLSISLIFGWTSYTLYGLSTSDEVSTQYIEVINNSAQYLANLLTGKVS